MIEKAWVGRELEGKEARGVRTLFVEAGRLEVQDLATVASVARREGVRRVYFGANRKSASVPSADPDWRRAVAELATQFSLVFETDAVGFESLCRELVDAVVVLRQDIFPISGVSRDALRNLRLKFDDHESLCGVSGVISCNSLDGLCEGKYENDKEVTL